MKLDSQTAATIYPLTSCLATTTGPQPMAVNFIREVIVNYRGPRRAKTSIRRSQDAADFIRRVLPDNSREHFVTLYLDGQHNVAGYALTATGTANSCGVHPREVFQNAVLLGAVSILVGHNHPSGNPAPSQEDMAITVKLNDAAEVLGIKCLDHVILGDDCHYSFAEGSPVHSPKGRD